MVKVVAWVPRPCARRYSGKCTGGAPVTRCAMTVDTSDTQHAPPSPQPSRDTRGATKTRAVHGLSDRGVRNLFIIPVLFLLIAFNVFPLLASLVISFTDFNPLYQNFGDSNYVGLGNYRALIHNPEQLRLQPQEPWKAFQRTAALVVTTVGLQTLIGFGVAMLLSRSFRGEGVLTSLLLIPMMLSPAVVATFWKYIFNADYGAMNWLFGLDWSWRGRSNDAFLAVVIVEVWMWTPFMMLLSLAGLNSIPPSLYEAAEVDRASAWFRFRNITLPLVAPLVLLGIIFRTMDTFRIFDVPFVLNSNQDGQPTTTVSVLLHYLGFGGSMPLGPATALAYLLLIVAIALANLVVKYLDYVRSKHG
jgi:multiple sugar transport system permease protein